MKPKRGGSRRSTLTTMSGGPLRRNRCCDRLSHRRGLNACGDSMPDRRAAGPISRGAIIMLESAEQMHARLCSVIAAARFEALSQPYAWEQVSGPSRVSTNALAVVRDGSAWYALAAVPPNTAGAYRILVFHFAEGSNASGFVAWLAGIMKKEAGTGVLVVCGFDARATPALWQTSLGLFDYWGCPWDRGDEVAALVDRLRREGAH